MSAASDALTQSRTALAKVLSDQGINPPNPDVLYWMLGQVYGESLFGTTPSWTIPNDLNNAETNPVAPNGPSHNWGSVHASPSATNFIWHYDQDRNGNPYLFKFARPGSPEAGAALYLKALLRLDINDAVKNVLNDPNGTPFDMARAMYTRNMDPNVLTYNPTQGYYSGVKGTDRERIQAYANMIASGANHVRSVLGVPNPGPTPPSPAPNPANQPSGVGAGVGGQLLSALLTVGAGIAVGYGVYRWKQRR